MRWLLLTLLLLTVAPLSAARVVVSVLPLAGVVDGVSCGGAQVHVLVPPGASPATWVPTLRDREAVQNADLAVRVVHPALAFERRWMGDLLADRPDLPVVDAAAGLPVRPGDPHLWTSPGNLGRMAAAVAAALGTEARCLEDYQAGLAAQAARLRARLGPLAGRRFYVQHPAWAYFAGDFGLEQVAIERDGKEPGPARLAALIAQARADGVRGIIVQPQFPDSGARTVARAIGAEVLAADPLARDMSAALDAFAAVLLQALGATP